ncbi:MAG TPA: ABC-type transport auxiliary lipoprotein family protein [Stellaceae bacterium]|nr:ABC-type transport auxiliary lipoprotein family protein [Stellaceae bacterium]
MSARRCIVLLLTATLAGCGSSPKTHYFTLAAEPGAAAAKPSIGYPVAVAAVRLPAALDRREMVRQSGATTVDVSDQDLWVAPLGALSRRVLSDDLAARLAPGSIVLPDAPQPPHTRRIVVVLDRFGPGGAGEAVLKGSWSLLEDKTGKPVLQREVALDTAALPGGEGQATAMSHLLGQLAAEMAAVLSEAGQPAGASSSGGRG